MIGPCPPVALLACCPRAVRAFSGVGGVEVVAGDDQLAVRWGAGERRLDGVERLDHREVLGQVGDL